MSPDRKWVLAAVLMACLPALLFTGPARADPMGSMFISGIAEAVERAVQTMIIVELLVIAIEAVFLGFALRLSPAMAVLWSLVANLLSATIGTVLLIPLMMWVSSLFDLNGVAVIWLTALFAFLLAVTIEFPLLGAIERSRTDWIHLLKWCAIMNLISVPIALFTAQLLIG